MTQNLQASPPKPLLLARTAASGLGTAAKSQNNRMAWVGRDLERSSSPTLPAMSRDIFTLIRLHRAPSNPTLSVSRDGASTTSLGNQFQCFSTLIVKNFFLIPSLNLPSLSFKLLPLVLLQQALLKCLSPSFL